MLVHLNQAVKAVAIARGFVAPSGMDLICIPAFIEIEIEGGQRTAIKLLVEPRFKSELFGIKLKSSLFYI